MRCSSTAQTGSSCSSPSASPYSAGWKHGKAQTIAPWEGFILVSNISNSPVSHCIAPKHISVGFSSQTVPTGLSLLWNAYLSHSSLSSQHQMPLAADKGDCDGWSKLLHWPGFSLIFNSFKYAPVLHRSQNTHWLCVWMPEGACVSGWHLSASHRTASSDWPKYIVLVALVHFHWNRDSSIMSTTLPNEMAYFWNLIGDGAACRIRLGTNSVIYLSCVVL